MTLHTSRSKTTLEPVIGLEIHAQISTGTKLFSGAKAEYAAPTNSQVAFLDAALPGTLPRLNRECVKAGVLTALALKCDINHVSKFDRKHYFYADLPAGYQITQQREPIAKHGEFTYFLAAKGKAKGTYVEKTARITQLQLEQDSGKSLHDADEQRSLIDLNRAGSALMEIVTEPDFRSAEEAAAFVKELRNTLMHIGTCNGRMEQGNLRVDASVSLHEPGTPLGTRAEVKNINSMRHVAKAIEYEIKRQKKLLKSGQEVESETRSFDIKTNETLAMRDKEKLHDYRFLPEPNLPPLRLYNNQTAPAGTNPSQIVNIDQVAGDLPELLDVRRKRLLGQYGLQEKYVNDMIDTAGMVEFFDDVLKSKPSRDAFTVNGLMLALAQHFNHVGDMSFLDSPVSAGHLAELVDLMEENQLTRSCAKTVLKLLTSEKFDSVKDVIEKQQLWKINDPIEIRKICQEILQNHPELIQEALVRNKRKMDPKRKFLNRLKDAYRGRIEEGVAGDVFQSIVEAS